MQLVLATGCAWAGWGSGSFALTACQRQKLRQTAASTKEKHVENRQAKGEAEGKVSTARE